VNKKYAEWSRETEPFPIYSRPISRSSSSEAKVTDTPAIWEVIVVDKAKMKVLESKMVVALNRDQALIKADVHRHFLVEEDFKNFTIVTRMIETIC
jgi:hypothetical protein